MRHSSRRMATDRGPQAITSRQPRPVLSFVPPSRVGGRPLQPSERARFEPAFGRDLSGVHVPADAGAAGPARQQQSWAQLAAAAQAETDLTRRSAAMVALVRRALPTRTVHEAGTSNTAAVDPADYDAVPAINFDVRLNSKTKWRSTTV